MGLDMITGQFGQPTELGFVVFTCGLCLVPKKSEYAPPQGQPPEPEGSQPEKVGAGKIRGRSPYAEQLHSGDPKD